MERSQSEAGVASAGAMQRLARDDSSRKRFLKMAGGTAAAGAFAALLAACGGSDEQDAKVNKSAPPTARAGDFKILNFALMLEYLESDFYDKVVSSGRLSGTALEMAKTFGEHENQHVDTLETAVKEGGQKPVARPRTKFELKGQEQILGLAAQVENLGAAAYLGQAAMIQSEDVLGTALSIHTVEARHAASLNIAIGKQPVPLALIHRLAVGFCPGCEVK